MAGEWGKADKALVPVRMLPGESRRQRVLTSAEESAFLEAASAVGDDLLEAYRQALERVRALDRGRVPIPPEEPHLLRDLATILMDCGLRPEESYRLRGEHVWDGAFHIQDGKTVNARRVIPLPARAAAILEMRHEARKSDEWVFPAQTRSGHVEQSTLKMQHTKACTRAGVDYFVPYALRHTYLARWAAHMDRYTLAYLAGHSHSRTTRRYVHPQTDMVLAAMERAQVAQTGHNFGHTAQPRDPAIVRTKTVIK